MSTWLWILIVIVAAIIVAAAVTVMMRQRRTATLRERFGPEYDRAIGESDNQRAAEAELRARERQRAQFDIRPLPEAARVRFAEQWRLVQERFVDQPSEASSEADQLVSRVMAERGYPMGDFASQADLISVDHPDVVENYRIAHAIHERAAARQASTEDLRVALLRYRSLFEVLLRPEPGAAAEGGMDEAAVDRTDAATARRTADTRPGVRSAGTGPDTAGPSPEGGTTMPSRDVAAAPAGDVSPPGDLPAPAAGEGVEAGRGTRRSGTGLGADDDAR